MKGACKTRKTTRRKEYVSRGNILVMMRASKPLVVMATMAMMIWVTGTAHAATKVKDPDRDHLTTKVEKNVTHTAPRDADTDDDGIKDGDEDKNSDGEDNEDEDDGANSSDECARGVEDDADEDSDSDDLDDEDENDFGEGEDSDDDGVSDDEDDD
jgi:hypothetical protein